MTQYKSLQPINLCWVLWDGPSEYELRWETHRSMPFLSDDWPTLWCSSVLWSSYRVFYFFCTEGPSMMNRMPMDALQFNIRYIISSNPTMTIPFCKKMTRGEWTVCQCLMAAGYVTVCLFAPFPNARWCGTWIAWNISWIAHGISEFPLKYGEFLLIFH